MATGSTVAQISFLSVRPDFGEQLPAVARLR